jgi:hypothetical protein
MAMLCGGATISYRSGFKGTMFMRFVEMLRVHVAVALLGMCLALSGCDKLPGFGAPNAEKAREIAKEAYIYGYPMVVHYRAIYARSINPSSGQYKAPINTIAAESRLYTPTDAVVRPSNDVLIATLTADLRAEPLVLCVPETSSYRYFSLQFVDLNMVVIGSFDGSQISNAGGCMLLSGPDFTGSVPTGVKKALTSTTSFVSVIYRTQVADPSDLQDAAKIQSGYTLQPLSAYLANNTWLPSAVGQIAWRPVTDKLLTDDFGPTMSFLLQFAPVADAEQAKRFARIGLGPKASKPISALSPEIQAAIAAGFRDGAAAIAARAAKFDTRVDGWQLDAPFGDSGFFGNDDLLRAAATSFRAFGMAPRDAMFTALQNDAAGAALDASTHGYTLTFRAGNQPPVNAFWSLTLYDSRTKGFHDNALGRYLVNSTMAENMVKAADGSLTIYIQPTSPGPGLESNWLPSPAGPFDLMLRMYLPADSAPTILPPGKGSWNPPAIHAGPVVAGVALPVLGAALPPAPAVAPPTKN